MPELPEVESTASSLRREVIGRTVSGSEVLWDRMVLPLSKRQFQRRVVGKEIAGVQRRGKYLILPFTESEESGGLVMHLRMSGRVRVEPADEPRDPYDRIVLCFSDGTECRFRDPRKFGRVTCCTPEELQALDRKLGPEPLDPSFTSLKLEQVITSRDRALKALLLDQSCIAGLGNIYVDESLWRAGLHPEKKSSSLTRPEVQTLFRVMRRVLNQAIKSNGTDFGDGVVYRGQFDPKVYGRSGEPCPDCDTPLERLVVAGRGSVVCNSCQSR